jgi:hypothetical protein
MALNAASVNNQQVLEQFLAAMRDGNYDSQELKMFLNNASRIPPWFLVGLSHVALEYAKKTVEMMNALGIRPVIVSGSDGLNYINEIGDPDLYVKHYKTGLEHYVNKPKDLGVYLWSSMRVITGACVMCGNYSSYSARLEPSVYNPADFARRYGPRMWLRHLTGQGLVPDLMAGMGMLCHACRFRCGMCLRTVTQDVSEEDILSLKTYQTCTPCSNRMLIRLARPTPTLAERRKFRAALSKLGGM